MILLAIYHTAAKFDGYFFPVYNDGWLVSVEPVPGRTNVSLVHMKFKKARDCNYISGQWYLGIPGASIGVATEWAEAPSIVISTDEIGDSHRYVNMSPGEIIRNSYLITTHDCYNGWLWKTQTLFWLSGRDNPDGLSSTWLEDE